MKHTYPRNVPAYKTQHEDLGLGYNLQRKYIVAHLSYLQYVRV